MKQRIELLTAYLHDALTPEEKQQVETLLRSDPTARAQLSDLRQTQLWLKRDLRTHLDGAAIPTTMTFDAISGRIKPQARHHVPKAALRTRWAASFAGIAALFFLSFALIYSIGDFDNTADPNNQPGSVYVITATPTETTFSMGESATIPTATPTRPTITPNSSIPTRTPNS